MSIIPQYLNDNRNWLNQQWDTIIGTISKFSLDELKGNPKFSGRIDPVTFEQFKKDDVSRIIIGGHRFNPDTIKKLLNTLSENPDSMAPHTTENDITLDEFIRFTVSPVAATDSDSIDDLTKIRLRIRLPPPLQERLLTQPELNWYFSGQWYQYNLVPLLGLTNPVNRQPFTIIELVYLYKVFFEPKHTRKGNQWKGGKINVKILHRSKLPKRRFNSNTSKRTRRRLSSKRAKRYTRHRRR